MKTTAHRAHQIAQILPWIKTNCERSVWSNWNHCWRNLSCSSCVISQAHPRHWEEGQGGLNPITLSQERFMKQKCCKVWMRDPTRQWENNFLPSTSWKGSCSSCRAKSETITAEKWNSTTAESYSWSSRSWDPLKGGWEDATDKEGEAFTDTSILVLLLCDFLPSFEKCFLEVNGSESQILCTGGQTRWPHEAVEMGAAKLNPVLTTLAQLNLS